MRLLDSLTSAFIHTFGITQPTEKARKRASRFIATLLCLTLLLVAAVGIVIFHFLHA